MLVRSQVGKVPPAPTPHPPGRLEGLEMPGKPRLCQGSAQEIELDYGFSGSGASLGLVLESSPAWPAMVLLRGGQQWHWHIILLAPPHPLPKLTAWAQSSATAERQGWHLPLQPLEGLWKPKDILQKSPKRWPACLVLIAQPWGLCTFPRSLELLLPKSPRSWT